ncbi:MAG: M28 family peptidase [Bacillota bacterium]
MTSTSLLTIAQTLTSFGERQGDAACRAGAYLEKELRRAGLSLQIDMLDTSIPRGTSTLRVDGQLVESLPTSMISGSITDASALTSSLIPSRYLIDVANINFNPKCSAPSVTNMYFAPALAVRPGDVDRILKAKEIRGTVEVRKESARIPQILVGNLKDPKVIVFTHYDSIGGPGAIDNASGTAVCLALCLRYPALLGETLFVFDPNEEVSYDYPTYWGHGYRAFATTYADVFKQAARILIVDSVGNGPVQEIRDPTILRLAFPVDTDGVRGDVVSLGGDIERMMEVYQSELDTCDLLDERYLEDALQKARELIECI